MFINLSGLCSCVHVSEFPKDSFSLESVSSIFTSFVTFGRLVGLFERKVLPPSDDFALQEKGRWREMKTEGQLQPQPVTYSYFPGAPHREVILSKVLVSRLLVCLTQGSCALCGRTLETAPTSHTHTTEALHQSIMIASDEAEEPGPLHHVMLSSSHRQTIINSADLITKSCRFPYWHRRLENFCSWVRPLSNSSKAKHTSLYFHKVLNMSKVNNGSIVCHDYVSR